MIIICDIDGTIAEKGDRNIFDYSKVHLDKPIMPVIDMMNLLITENSSPYNDIQRDLIFVSGREDKCFDQTKEWLQLYIHGYFDLFMRETGDQRNDDIVKREIYENNIVPLFVRENIPVIVFDDRPRVIRMWRELGLFVFNCAQHDREF